MDYIAYIKINDLWHRVFPRTKTETRFKKIESAVKRLECRAKLLNQNCQGVITAGYYGPTAPGFDWDIAKTIQL